MIYGREKGNGHGHSSRQRSFVRRFFCVRSDDCGFDDQAHTAATNAEQHKWFSADFVHEDGANGIENDADCDPATLEF
jgi:hypothetical protein